MPKRQTPNEIFGAELIQRYVPVSVQDMRLERLRRSRLRGELEKLKTKDLRDLFRDGDIAGRSRSRYEMTAILLLPRELRPQLYGPAMSGGRALAEKACMDVIGDTDTELSVTDDEHPLVVDGCGGAGGDGEADEEDEAPLAEVFVAQRARGRARAADDAVSRSLRQRPAASTGGGRGSMATVSGDVPFSILWRRSKSPRRRA